MASRIPTLRYPQISWDTKWSCLIWYGLILGLSWSSSWVWKNLTSFNHQGQPPNHYNFPRLPNESKWHHATSESKTTTTTIVAVFIVAYSMLYFHYILYIYILNIFPCPKLAFQPFSLEFHMAGAVKKKKTDDLHTFKELFLILWPDLWLSVHHLCVTYDSLSFTYHPPK